MRNAYFLDEERSPIGIHTDNTGVARVLNLKPSPMAFRAAYRVARSAPIDESTYPDFHAWPASCLVKDQGQRGACDGHAAALSGEATRATAGMTHVPLSAWFIYAILCNGRDVGASIADALTLISSQGMAPESSVPYGLINPRRLTQAAHAEALRFKVGIGNAVDGFDEVLSEVAAGRFLNVSIHVGDDFSTLDPDGVPGIEHGPCNHAVCVGGGIKTAANGGKLVLMPNSWGTAWGDDGFAWISRELYESGTGREGYVVQAIDDDPEDATNPLPVAA